MPLLKSRCCLVAFLTLAPATFLTAQTPAPAPNPAPAYPPPPEGIVVLHDVVFGKGGYRNLHADIAYPKDAPGPLPAVICIHGGGWIEGNQHQAPIVHLAQAGYFAASIEYRLDNVAQWPAQIEDCKLGVRWLRANAGRYHVDPNRIGAWGDSAGGHLVLCLGTMADVKEYEGNGGFPGVSSAVQAVVDYYGPTDFTHPDSGIYTPKAIELTQGLFGVPFTQNPALWRSGSPLFYVKAGDPPMLLVHGDSDDLVPLAQSTMFDAALTKAGVPHRFIIVKNAGHGFAMVDPSRPEIYQAVDVFLAKYLKAP
jgi:acetyl esterase/lipase